MLPGVTIPFRKRFLALVLTYPGGPGRPILFLEKDTKLKHTRNLLMLRLRTLKRHQFLDVSAPGPCFGTHWFIDPEARSYAVLFITGARFLGNSVNSLLNFKQRVGRRIGRFNASTPLVPGEQKSTQDHTKHDKTTFRMNFFWLGFEWSVTEGVS